MTTPNIRDLESLFYGGGEDAKYNALQAFAEQGWDATTLLTILETSEGPQGDPGPAGPRGGLGPSAVVVREVAGVGETPTTADYLFVAGDVGKLLIVEATDNLPVRVIMPSDIGEVGDRIEVASSDVFEIFVTNEASLVVPDGKSPELSAPFGTVSLTQVFADEWLLSGNLADSA